MLRLGEDGIQWSFDNGYTVSMQWGAAHYCSNRNLSDNCKPTGSSPNCEICIVDPNGDAVKLEGDWVKGWVSTEKLVGVLAYVQQSERDAQLSERRIISLIEDD